MKYTIIVDKQPMSNPSSEKKEYTIDIEELRTFKDISDTLTINMDIAYVTRRLQLSEYGVLSVLPTPIKEELTDLNIKLFEGENYIYILNEQGNKISLSYLIKNDFNDTFVTRNEMNSAITQTAQSIELSVNQKLEGYSTTEEMNAAIKITADSINSEVSKKVGEDEVCSVISQSADEILLKGNRVLIESNKFNLSKNGDVTCENININSGKIKLDAGSSSNPNFKIGNDLFMTENYFSMGKEVLNGDFISISASSTGTTEINVNSKGKQTRILASGIETPKLTQTSLAEQKKNFERMQDNAINIIKKIDIYKYNLKSEKDTDKKHIGFVIGEGYNYAKEVTSLENDGVDNYSFTSLCCKAIQEQQKIIGNLQEEINKLKEVTNGKNTF